jgi:hypothetical protein
LPPLVTMIVVQVADVPGGEPAVPQHPGGRPGVVEVAGEDDVAVHPDLPVAGDVDGVARHRAAHRAELDAAHRLAGHRRGGLGQSVAVVDRDPGAGEDQAEFAPQRGAARDRVPHTPAQHRPQLPVDGAVEDRVRGPEHRPRAGTRARVVPFHGLGVAHRDVHRPVEHIALAGLQGDLPRPAVDLLEDVGDGEDERRPEGRERGQQQGGRDLRLVAQQYAVADAEDLHHQSVDVGQRQEGEDGRLLALRGDEAGPSGEQDVALGREVGVGDHTALGAPGGAGGVGDGGDRARCHREAVAVHQIVGDAAPQFGQLPYAAVVELPDAAQRRRRVAHRAHRHGVLLVLDDYRHHLRVGQDPAHLLGGGGGVDGHDLGADRPQRVAEQRPLVAGAGHHRDPVVEPYAVGQQALGQGPHLVAEGGGGDGGPLTARRVLAAGELCEAGVALGQFVDRVRQPSRPHRLHHGRKAEIAHGTPITGPLPHRFPGGRGRKIPMNAPVAQALIKNRSPVRVFRTGRTGRALPHPSGAAGPAAFTAFTGPAGPRRGLRRVHGPFDRRGALRPCARHSPHGNRHRPQTPP